jgi:hypothetical protein
MGAVSRWQRCSRMQRKCDQATRALSLQNKLVSALLKNSEASNGQISDEKDKLAHLVTRFDTKLALAVESRAIATSKRQRPDPAN